MEKERDNRTRQITVKPLQAVRDGFLEQNPDQLEWFSVPTKQPSIYGINEGNTVEGRNWRQSFWFLIDRYGQKTTVHALTRICQRRTGHRERIIWSFGFFAALYLLTTMYATFASRYRRKQLQTTVNDTFFPIYKISYPEVVICNNNRLNWKRLNESMAKFLMPEHRTPEFEKAFTNIVAHYDSVTLYTMYEFHGLAEKPLSDLNYINFTSVVDFMSWRCDEILSDCKWRLKSVNCCEIFFPRRTSLGQCLAFNSVLSSGGRQKAQSDRFWPWHYGQSGRGSGLQLRVLLDGVSRSYKNLSDGILFMTIDPGCYSDYMFTPVRANHTAYVAIWGSVSFLNHHASDLPLSERGCVFDGELNSLRTLKGLKYQQENCLYECQRQQMIRACKCTADLFFPPSEHPSCQLVDMPCLATHWNSFVYSEALGTAGESEGGDISDFHSTDSPCNCYFSCSSVLLEDHVVIESIPLQNVPAGIGSYIDLDFYWGRSYLIVYKTSFVYTWLDLLVSFGGITSLLMGCSLISVIELLVFLLLEAPDFLRKKQRSDKRLKELQEKSNIQNLIDYDRTH